MRARTFGPFFPCFLQLSHVGGAVSALVELMQHYVFACCHDAAAPTSTTTTTCSHMAGDSGGPTTFGR